MEKLWLSVRPKATSIHAYVVIGIVEMLVGVRRITPRVLVTTLSFPLVLVTSIKLALACLNSQQNNGFINYKHSRRLLKK